MDTGEILILSFAIFVLAICSVIKSYEMYWDSKKQEQCPKCQSTDTSSEEVGDDFRYGGWYSTCHNCSYKAPFSYFKIVYT